MKICKPLAGFVLVWVFISAASVLAAQTKKTAQTSPAAASPDQIIQTNAHQMLEDGRKIFRYDTFGDEAFWGGALRLHQAIAGEKQGGVGPGVSPKTALAVGLKVDLDALPASLVDQLKAG